MLGRKEEGLRLGVRRRSRQWCRRGEEEDDDD